MMQDYTYTDSVWIHACLIRVGSAQVASWVNTLIVPFYCFYPNSCVIPIGAKPANLKNSSEPAIEESSCLNIAGGVCYIVMFLSTLTMYPVSSLKLLISLLQATTAAGRCLLHN